MIDSTSSFLSALSATPAKVNKVHFLKKQGKAVAQRIEHIFKSEFDIAFNAVAIGVMLFQVKGLCVKGEFQPWIKTHLGARAYRSSAYYTKLSIAFAKEVELTPEEAIALTTLKLKGAKSGAAKSAFEKLTTFIGEESLTDLMIKHDVRSVGLKSTLKGAAQPALTEAEQAQLELDLIWSQAYEPAKSLAELLVDKAGSLKPDQREALEAELKKALQALRAA